MQLDPTIVDLSHRGDDRIVGAVGPHAGRRVIPRTATLTLIRVVAPAAVVAAVWAVAVTDDPTWLAGVALTSTTLAAVAALAS